jgi:AcrR family transcriptional regulator
LTKKKSIFNTAVRLFASQGYEATTTLQIAKEVGVTEPAVFYHFKSKNAFFSTILEDASRVYFDRLDALKTDAPTAFESLEALIRIHFSIVKKETELMRILLRTCPLKLQDPESTCTQIYRDARSRLTAHFRNILKKGISSGEFVKVDIDATSNLLIAMLNGLMRQQIAALDTLRGVEAATINFCRQALLKQKAGR